MARQIVISKGFLKFIVTVDSNEITVETYGHCKYGQKVSDTFAVSERLMIEHYMRSRKLPRGSFEDIVMYVTEKGWAVIEIS
jgi:hypothetical protein